MLGSPILEAALGLALVFLLFSLLISAVNEIVFGHLNHRRANLLADGLKLLLSGRTTKTDAIVTKRAETLLSELSAKLSSATTSTPTEDAQRKKPTLNEINGLLSNQAESSNQPTFAEKVLAHPLILSLSATNQKVPSYIPTKVFADAVLGVLLKAKFEANPKFVATIDDLTEATAQLPAHDQIAKDILRALLMGRRDLAEVRERIERWFDDAVERIGGTYRRKTQFWLYIWASVITLLLNIDTIEITKRLLVDASLRQSLVRSAEAAATNDFYRIVPGSQTNFSVTTNLIVLAGPPAVTNRVLSTNLTVLSTNTLRVADQLAGDIATLRLPIGWGGISTNTDYLTRTILLITGATTNDVQGASGLITLATVSNPPPLPRTISEWLLKLLGLFLTVCAISQGAPFWFDLLNRVTNLRAAGTRPGPSTPPVTK